jgi:hypothetical protein
MIEWCSVVNLLDLIQQTKPLDVLFPVLNIVINYQYEWYIILRFLIT